MNVEEEEEAHPCGVPFPPNEALDQTQLQSASCSAPSCGRSTSTPEYTPKTTIPDAPDICLSDDHVDHFICRELESTVLDELYDHLWLVARKAHDNIDPLHQQLAKGRQVIITEDPKLHLVWQRDKVFIKPIPLCLLNHSFWEHFLCSTKALATQKTTTRNTTIQQNGTLKTSTIEAKSPPSPKRRSLALGFLRTYAHLIQHRSDLEIAKQHFLIPASIEYSAFARFIHHFRDITDAEVAPRYHYGQLRLSRLHWVTRLYRPKSNKTAWFYEQPHWSISAYIADFIGPLLFVFGGLSIALSAMQVMLAVPDGVFGLEDARNHTMGRAYWIFAVSVTILSALSWVLIIVVPLVVIVWQLQFGFRQRFFRRGK